MSSFKNAIPKRKYRERSQPEHRKHLGLLEKKRDYQVRAADTHKKEKELEKLRDKAFYKNPDEFYYAMENTRLIGGKHRREAKEIPSDLKKKQKILEGNLLEMKVQNKKSKHEQLQSGLHLIDSTAVNKHIIYVNDKEKIENFDLAEHFDTVPELVSKKSNRLRKIQLENTVLYDLKEAEGYKELEELIKDEKLLTKSLESNFKEKKFMGKEKFKIIDEEKNICKWFRERKR